MLGFLPSIWFCHLMFIRYSSISAYLLEFDILYGFLLSLFLCSLGLFSYSHLTHTYAFKYTWIVMILKNTHTVQKSQLLCIPCIRSLFISSLLFFTSQGFYFLPSSVSQVKAFSPFHVDKDCRLLIGYCLQWQQLQTCLCVAAMIFNWFHKPSPGSLSMWW